MANERSKSVIEVERLPGGENAFRFDGHQHGAQVSFFLSHNRPATGPELHRHPYEETFIVEGGNVRFTVGEETIEATAGEIVVVPAETPHKFVNSGTAALRQISIHPVARMETEWLSDQSL
jgi:mannose-6-phosphate isomerase-like protein (cupin superfamily)